MRIQPKLWLAIVIGLGYAALFAGLFRLSGVDYDLLSASSENVLRAVLIPMLILAVITAGITTYFGWWPSVWRDRAPVTGSKALIAIPVLLVITWLATINFNALSQSPPSYLVLVLVATLMVGFNEELVYRGLAVVGARGDGTVREVWVWLTSATLFSLLHAWNLLLGQDLAATAQQLVFTFVYGTILYAIRRLGAPIVVLMVVHGLWDWSAFTSSGDVSGHNIPGSILVGLTLPLMIAMVILFIVARKKLFPKEPAGSVEVAPTT